MRTPLSLALQNFGLLLFPALAFPLWLHLGGPPRWQAELARPTSWPWQVVGLAGCGILATICGIGDWVYHRLGFRVLPAAESRMERRALLLGVPMFATWVLASILPWGRWLLLPGLALVLTAAHAIVEDERRFHRRVGVLERLMHRGLVFGHLLTLVFWTVWTFSGPVDANPR